MSLAPLMGFGVHAQYLNDCSQVQIEDSLMIFVAAGREYFVQHVLMLDVYWFLCVFAEKKKGWDRGGGKICSAYEFFSWLFLLGSLAGSYIWSEQASEVMAVILACANFVMYGKKIAVCEQLDISIW